MFDNSNKQYKQQIPISLLSKNDTVLLIGFFLKKIIR